MSQPAVLDKSGIERVARLAALSLAPHEIEQLASELEAIVRHVEELNSVDTSDVPPTYNVQLKPSPLRADVVEQSLPVDKVLAEAPRHAHGGFAVPAFVEG